MKISERTLWGLGLVALSLPAVGACRGKMQTDNPDVAAAYQNNSYDEDIVTGRDRKDYEDQGESISPETLAAIEATIETVYRRELERRLESEMAVFESGAPTSARPARLSRGPTRAGPWSDAGSSGSSEEAVLGEGLGGAEVGEDYAEGGEGEAGELVGAGLRGLPFDDGGEDVDDEAAEDGSGEARGEADVRGDERDGSCSEDEDEGGGGSVEFRGLEFGFEVFWEESREGVEESREDEGEAEDDGGARGEAGDGGQGVVGVVVEEDVGLGGVAEGRGARGHDGTVERRLGGWHKGDGVSPCFTLCISTQMAFPRDSGLSLVIWWRQPPEGHLSPL